MTTAHAFIALHAFAFAPGGRQSRTSREDEAWKVERAAWETNRLAWERQEAPHAAAFMHSEDSLLH